MLVDATGDGDEFSSLRDRRVEPAGAETFVFFDERSTSSGDADRFFGFFTEFFGLTRGLVTFFLSVVRVGVRLRLLRLVGGGVFGVDEIDFFSLLAFDAVVDRGRPLFALDVGVLGVEGEVFLAVLRRVSGVLGIFKRYWKSFNSSNSLFGI